MPAFNFGFGQIVYISPDGDPHRLTPKGRIVGRVEYIDGSVAYFVSVREMHAATVTRHLLTEFEIQPVPEAEA